MRITLYLLALVVSFFPSALFAQNPDLNYFDIAVEGFGALVNQLIPIVIALALLVFIWGLVKFIASSGDDTAKAEGKNRMVWGIIALFVIVAVWGLVELLAEITGVELGGNIDAPGVNM